MKVPTVLLRSRKWQGRFLDCEAQLLFLFICISPSPYSHRFPASHRASHLPYNVPRFSRNFTSFLSIIPFSPRARSLMLARCYCPECVRSK
jgi:hypothetical protein